MAREQLYETEKKKWEEGQMKCGAVIEEANATIYRLESALQEQQCEKISDENNQMHNIQVNEMLDQIKYLEQALKQKEEQLGAQRSAQEKEKAIL